MSEAARRGWREPLGDGLSRTHRVQCAASRTRKPGARCACPYTTQVTQGPGLPSQTVTFEARNLRDARAKQREAQKKARNRTGKPSGHIKFREFFFDVYLPTRTPPMATRYRRDSETTYLVHVDPYFGDVLLSRIGREQVDRWVAYLTAVYSQRTAAGHTERRWLHKQFNVLKTALRYAEEWERIDESPAKRVVLPSAEQITVAHLRVAGEPGDPTRVLTREQFAVLQAEALRVPLRARSESGLRNWLMFECAFVHGLRNSEVRALRLPDFKLTGDTLEMRIARSVDVDPARSEKSTKNGKVHRHPVSDEFAAAVRLRRNWLRNHGYGEDSFLFPAYKRPSLPITLGVPQIAIDRVQRRAGLVDEHTGEPLVHFHGLRHSCATDLYMVEQWTIEQVSGWLRHSDVDVTRRIYVHFAGAEGWRDAAAERQLGLQAARATSQRGELGGVDEDYDRDRG